MSDSPTYEARLRRFYAPLLRMHGATHRGVGWGSAENQEARFQILLAAEEKSDCRVLDVGCGLGHLPDYLKKQSFQGRYLGVDLVPEMIEAARGRHPAWDFRQGGVDEHATEFGADLVVGSGLFTFADEALLEQTVTAMFRACRRAVAFNTLSAWADQKDAGEFYAEPNRVVEFCRSLTPWVVLRHDYLPHDFTVYLYRNQR